MNRIDRMATVPNGIAISMQYEDFHTILYKSFSIGLGVGLGLSLGENTVAETETNKNGLYRLVWRCSYMHRGRNIIGYCSHFISLGVGIALLVWMYRNRCWRNGSLEMGVKNVGDSGDCISCNGNRTDFG